MSLRPLIAIFGTTGVGKSNLAIELAVHLSQPRGIGIFKGGARIINADAMQVYAGLDVLTNKVPEAERRGVEHLLMGFKQPGEQYVVGQWVQDAVDAIDEIHGKNQIPIVVGGTSYWIQHLMFPDRLAGAPGTSNNNSEATPKSDGVTTALAGLPSPLRALFDALPMHPPDAAVDPSGASALHALLAGLDPPVAARWHWRDTRKVLRSLRIVADTGRLPSEIVQAQAETRLEPRYRTLCFWVYGESGILNAQLDARVDKMIENGLLDEVRALHEISQSAAPSPEVDYTLGIYQSIGYKEFHAYLSASPSLPSQKDNAQEKAFAEALEAMKISTRQYAKRQISWIRNKLLPAIREVNAHEHGAVVPTYLLDATDLGEHWDARVRDPAVRIMQDFLTNDPLPDPLTVSDVARRMLGGDDSRNAKSVDPTAVLRAQRKQVCYTCTLDEAQPFLVDEERMGDHLRGRAHRRRRKAVEVGEERVRRVVEGEANRKEEASPGKEEGEDVDLDAGSLFS
ncbi:tRNA isopentenyltransferase [Mycena rebaudengoi]|nr:tRNA isopentenyltransferase [Mycena rebaudengoi]